MPGYQYTRSLHVGVNTAFNQLYAVTLPGFRSFQYIIIINAIVTPPVLPRIVVYSGHPTQDALIYVSPSIPVGIPVTTQVVLTAPIHYVLLSISGGGSINITDYIDAVG